MLPRISPYVSDVASTAAMSKQGACVKTVSIVATSLVAMVATYQASAQDVDEGKALYKKECRGCHGPTAKGLASYPKLVGHPAEYLVEKLERYRAGEKIGPNTPLMAPRAKKLSDEDITNIVTFIVTTFE